jgi:hypothetical protein
MPSPESILERLLLVGGPPRSGTKLAAWILNAHPRIVTAVDDHVNECWALYHYPSRQGLVQELRAGPVSRAEMIGRLQGHLFDAGHLVGAAPSAKTSRMPLSKCPGSLAAMTPGPGGKIVRHSFPLECFGTDGYLCLKSPEISFVLPELAGILDSARFILVYRPIIEIAESMHRMGNLVRRFPVFHRRWDVEKSSDGRRIPPPGVPQEWSALWQAVTGFQRCVIYAASYVRAMNEGMDLLPGGRFFLYDHARMRAHGDELFRALASFLDVEASGFAPAGKEIRGDAPAIPAQLRAEYEEMTAVLPLEELMQRLDARAAGDKENPGKMP